MAVTTERFDRLEDRVNDVTEKTNELRGAYEHLARKEDIAELKSWLIWRGLITIAIIQGIGIAFIKYLP